MRPHGTKAFRFKKVFGELLVAAVGLVLAVPGFAQVSGSSPWKNDVNVLQAAFTSTIARGLSLVAIVKSYTGLRTIASMTSLILSATRV